MSARSAHPAPLSAAAPSDWGDLASEFDRSTLLGSAAVPPSAASTPQESALEVLVGLAGAWFSLLRGVTLAAAAAASGSVAAAGLALLLFLALTTRLTPPYDTFSRPLALDFSQSDLEGEALFAPALLPARGDGLPPAPLPSDARFLAPGQAVDVWVELVVPRSTQQGLAQVVATLTSADGRPAARASRAIMMRSDWWSLSSLLRAPLRWLGLAEDLRRLHVPLFTGYREKWEVPFATARIAVKTRNPGWAAEVLAATVKVQLRLGWRRPLYALRPGWLALPLLWAAGGGALLGGSAASLLFLALLLWAGLGGGGGGGGAADEAGSVAASEEVEVSSASANSDVSSALLRELDESSEPPSPRLHPGMPTAPGGSAGGLAASVAQRWRDDVPLGGAAVPGSGYTPLRGKGPADSAMGSEAGGSGWLGALRRRAGSAKPAASSQ